MSHDRENLSVICNHAVKTNFSSNAVAGSTASIHYVLFDCIVHVPEKKGNNNS